MTASGHTEDELASLDKQLATDLIEANQRIGELEVMLADRERALRNLRIRLLALEKSGGESEGRLEEELQAARWRLAELESRGAAGTDSNGVILSGTTAQEELRKIMATKTWRYTYPIRVRIFKIRRRLAGRAPNE